MVLVEFGFDFYIIKLFLIIQQKNPAHTHLACPVPFPNF